MATSETVDGYLIDVGCIRKNTRYELLEKAQTHSSEWALMGLCVEGGYGIVTDDDRTTVLDSEATPRIVHAVEESTKDEGIRLRVRREERDDTVETTDVEELN